MRNVKGAALLLALMMVGPATAAGEETGALTMLGVQVKDTPAPTASPTPTVTATPAQEATPDEATPDDALMAPITQEEREAAGLGERILIRGMEGEDVALMQRRLYQLGYYLGEIDGVFGLGTRTAVYGFQRAHSLEKIDGKVGPETISRMFSDNVVVKPTPTPTPTPTPKPTPTPSPTPKPTPGPSATPSASGAPFALETLQAFVDEREVTLTFGRDGQGELLYPLCGVMGWLDYDSSYAAGSWQLVQRETGAEIALMTDGQDGLCEGAMGSAGGVIFLADDACRVYVYGEEAYLTAAALRRMGLSVVVAGGTPVIH